MYGLELFDAGQWAFVDKIQASSRRDAIKRFKAAPINAATFAGMWRVTKID